MLQKLTPKKFALLTWLGTADQLSPPYDYFDFANICDLDKRRTNAKYFNVMKKALSEANAEEKTRIAQIIKQFNSKERKKTPFSEKYNTYWNSREETESEEKIVKRQREAAEAANELTCSTFEAIMKKIAAAAVGDAVISQETGGDPTSNISERDKNSNAFSDTFCEKIISLDDNFPHRSESMMNRIKETTDLPSTELSGTCKSLLRKIDLCPPSAQMLRKTIRSHAAEMDEPFDLVLHNDLNFTETMATHFLDLMQSPRNPLLQEQSDKHDNIFRTIIPILHNLCLGCNDKIHTQGVAEQVSLSNKRSWEFVVFLVNDGLLNSSFVDPISAYEDEISQEKRPLHHLTNLLQIEKAKGVKSPILYFIEYQALEISFRSLSYHDDCYVKRSYFKLICPSTPRELKTFVEEIPNVYKFRQALLNQVS